MEIYPWSFTDIYGGFSGEFHEVLWIFLEISPKNFTEFSRRFLENCGRTLKIFGIFSMEIHKSPVPILHERIFMDFHGIPCRFHIRVRSEL